MGTINLRTPEGPVVVQTTPEVALGVRGQVPVAVNGASITFTTEPDHEPDRDHDRTRQEIERARRDVQRLTAQLEAARARLAAAEAGAGRAGNGGNPGVPAPRAPMGGATSFRGGEPEAGTSFHRVQRDGPVPDQQRRLDDLERKLDRLLDEVQNLKQGRLGRVEADKPSGLRAY